MKEEGESRSCSFFGDSAFISEDRQLWLCRPEIGASRVDLGDLQVSRICLTDRDCWIVATTGELLRLTLYSYFLSKTTSPVVLQPTFKIRALTCYQRHYTRLLLLDTRGKVWELKRSTTTFSPRKLKGVRHIKSFSAGRYHCMYLDRKGRVWMKGTNEFGAAGISTSNYYGTPTLVPNLPPIAQVSTGKHTLFLTKEGEVWGCGKATRGRLGVNLTDSMQKKRSPPTFLTPFRIENLPPIKAVSTGAAHSLFLDLDGVVWSCGSNQYGQLGQKTKQLSPVENLPKIATIKAGRRCSVFIDYNSTIWVCGKAEDQFGLQYNKNSNVQQIETIPPILRDGSKPQTKSARTANA